MKFLIYYRTLPNLLMDYLTKDLHMTYSKDGIYVVEGHATPRLSVTVHPVNVHSDKERVRRLTQILEELKINNQIVDWN
jgi:hypothetical protein